MEDNRYYSSWMIWKLWNVWILTLLWLLLRGPAYRVWPIVTVNVERGKQVQEWLDAFHTRLYGHIQHTPETEEALFRSLRAGVQFVFREGDGWMKFWILPTP